MSVQSLFHRFKYALVACGIIFFYLGVSTFMSRNNRYPLVSIYLTRNSSHATTTAWPSTVKELQQRVTSNTTPAYQPTIIKGKDINSEIIEHVKVRNGETRDPLVNLHSYQLRLNTHVCKFGKTFLVMMIHSAPQYFAKRALIRSTYGSVGMYKQRNITRVFMIGEVGNSTIQEQINNESRIHGDIVQGNFPDRYRTLVKKHVMAMYWYTNYCNAEYILKLDDDTFVNPYRLIDYIDKIKPAGLRMWCRIARKYIPFRSTSSKYYTPRKQYPWGKFHDFCLGFAYLTTPEAVRAMYKASVTTRIMNMDDVYVGILSMRANVRKNDFTDVLAQCVKKNHMNVSDIKKRPIVMDLIGRCGNLPFKHWKEVGP